MGGPARVYVGGMPGSQNRYKKIKYTPVKYGQKSETNSSISVMTCNFIPNMQTSVSIQSIVLSKKDSSVQVFCIL